MRIIIACAILFFTQLVTRCREPYNPAVISSTNSALVVEAVLNAGQGPTSIRLTRSFVLDDTASLQVERNAQVVVEGKDNSTRQLPMTADGVYSSPSLGLQLNQEYRLRITTDRGKEYVSEFVVAKNTAGIDSIGFDQNEKGVQLWVNAHDDNNTTRYYLFDFDETWEINSYYISRLKYENEQMVLRPEAERVSICWKHDRSNKILLASTAALALDVLHKAPIFFINNGDDRLDVKYSILLRQSALDKRGYEFYERMRKNTETLGSIFDAQPSEIRGNITCISNPEELVIGYVSASVVREKRIFISKSQLPLGWNFIQDCPKTRVPNIPDSIRHALSNMLDFIDEIRGPAGEVVAYNAARIPCLDCRRRDGSLLKPSFWP